LGFGQAVRELLGNQVQAHQLERIVLITHYGCAYYGQQLGQPPDEWPWCGGTLAEVRAAAGHSNVTITSGYLHVAVEEDKVGALFGCGASPHSKSYAGPLRL
jgi:hypothetical protein